MPDPFVTISARLSVKLLVIGFATLSSFQFHDLAGFFPVRARAAEVVSADIPAGWESSLDRPDILKLPAESRRLETNWELIKDAHFSFIAELLALYPRDTSFYFLARDSEYLYDVARLVTEGTPDAERISLLNISRVNMKDSNLKAYLKDNGISEETVRAGKKVLFVDTGFSGTISRVIGESFPLDVREKLRTHLIASAGEAGHPSSRTFLIHLNPSANEISAFEAGSTVIGYEGLAKYSNRSSRFILSNGRYHPISSLSLDSDGYVSKVESLRLMKDLKAEWQKPEVRTRFQTEKKQFEKLKKLLVENSGNEKAALIAELKIKKNTLEGRKLEAQVRDIMEIQKNAGFQIKTGLDELGLSLSPIARKNELLKQYPDLAPILKSPGKQIPELFRQENWQAIKSLIDANINSEINWLTVKSLFDESTTGIKKDLQIHMIAGGDSSVLEDITERIKRHPHPERFEDLLKLVNEKMISLSVVGSKIFVSDQGSQPEASCASFF